MKVTIGGDRVGSGKKMKAHLHNYFRSTHNLSEKFASSMGSGILYPAMCKLAMRGDSFDIDLAADCRTIPTQGPLFGSYKMQVDLYQVPIRLYQGILHNNPLKIGLNMSQVLFPLLDIVSRVDTEKSDRAKMNDSSLLKYLGFSGMGRGTSATERHRKINAIPALAYYDIFKNYYANKQEDKAYVISAIEKEETIGILFDEEAKFIGTDGSELIYNWNDEYKIYLDPAITIKPNKEIKIVMPCTNPVYILKDEDLMDTMTISYVDDQSMEYSDSFSNFEDGGDTLDGLELTAIIGFRRTKTGRLDGEYRYDMVLTIKNLTDASITLLQANIYGATTPMRIEQPLSIVPFDLENIDDMRYDLLSHNRLGETFVITGFGQDRTYLPYLTLVDVDNDAVTLNKYPLNGLVLKTYQNDIFNNWLNSEQIEGEGSITELTKVQVTDGKFSMDALSFAEKLYNMLNRIAVAGATYEDWQDVVYEEAKRRQIESPIFLGGMSQEVMFDEIIQNAPTNIDGNTQPLGTLGGRGRLIKESKKGGKIHVKVDEASFIIAIASLTPRVFYTQGNEFYLTDLMSMDDLHKPAMDGIGFQDLIGERLAWWDTVLKPAVGTNWPIERSKIGKLPAWIEYMTSYDRAYGDFAGEYGDKAGFMVLSRNYEVDPVTGGIKDATTYIDPSKYNYAFADTKLEAQNFWVEIQFNITARRLMSAKLIPSV